MADFRKLVLVLAVMAFAASAFAQAPFVCVGNPAVPATLRGGGLTEEVGDVVLTCSGGAVGTASGSFQVLMPGSAVTNRIGDLQPGKGFPTTGVALTVEISGTVTQVVQGFLQQTIPVDTPASRNLVIFPNVNIPTGTVSANVRISGIRVAVPVVTSTAVATSVFEIVSTSPSNIIPVTNSTQQVGLVLPGLQFNVANCDGSAGSTSLSLQQCTDFNLADGNPAKALTFAVRFTEGFPTAFKIPDGTVGSPLALPTATNGAAEGFNGEFTGRVFTAGGVTVADQPGAKDSATRLIFTMTNVPAGVTVRVTDRQLPASSGAQAIIVPGANSNGAGDVPTLSTSGDKPTCPGLDTTANPVFLVDANSSGSTVYAVWEVTHQTLNTDSLLFGVEISFAANPGAGSPALTGTTPAVSGGNFAPQSTVNFGDKSSPIPRFNTPAITNGTLAIVPCVTNLLFPYVTNLSGYDTGIAIVNTSKDNGSGSTTAPAPFNTSPQTGACTVYFFGNNTIAPQTTPSVTPGSLVKFALSAPPSTFTAATAGFEGYIIAQCAFQYAHGLAFILNPTGSGSEYLALVIPDQGGSRPPVNFVANGGAGEQLAY